LLLKELLLVLFSFLVTSLNEGLLHDFQFFEGAREIGFLHGCGDLDLRELLDHEEIKVKLIDILFLIVAALSSSLLWLLL
jgi:hypothetical protein